MNTQRLRTVPLIPPEPVASDAPAPTAPPLVPAPVVPVVAPLPLAQDTSSQQTSVMQFDDLEEFRQAARTALNLDAEEDRVTPTGLMVSPFARLHEAPLHADLPLAQEVPFVPVAPSASPPLPVVEPPAPSAPESVLSRSFRDASWPKRVTVLLLPIVIGLYGLKAFRHHAPAPQSAKHAASAPSASAAAAPSLAPTEPASNTDSVAAPSALPASPSDERGPSLQRRAVDAYATGNFPEAATLYRRLAAEHPERAEFAVAAQIAGEKAKGGQRE